MAQTATTEGEWRWLENGSESDQFWQGDDAGYHVGDSYTNWESGKPDNYSGNQNYLYIKSDGYWNDEANTHPAVGYVVEWNADEVLDATESLTYAIQSQTVSGAFTIDSDSGEISVADGSLLDYETNTSHTLTVRVTDGDTAYVDQAFTIQLADITEQNNAPSDLSSGIELNTDDGNDAYLISTSGLSQSLSSSTVEIRFAADNTPDETVFMSFNNATGDEYSLQINAPSNNLEIDFGSGTTAESSAMDYTSLLDGEIHTLSVSWDSTNGDWMVYVDGELVDSGTGLSAGSSLDTTNGQFVFWSGTGRSGLRLRQYPVFFRHPVRCENLE